MLNKPTYEELEKRVAELEKELSELRQLEGKLEAKEQTLRALLNAPHEASILFDLEGTILAANEIFAKRLNRNLDELIGKELFECFPPDVAASRRARMDEVVRTGNPLNFQDERAGRFFDNNIYPVLDAEKKVRSVAVYSKDITESKQTEKALSESEERFSKAFHFSPAPLYISSIASGCIIDVNEGFLKTVGYGREEVIGRTSLELNVWVDPRDRSKSRDITLQGKKAFFPELKVRKKSGEIRILNYSAVKIEVDGEPCTLVSGNDITDQKKAEQKNEKLIQELKEALKEIKALRGILPLCSFCKKIRNDKGYWEQVDVYIDKHSQADISHGICPACAKKHYPDFTKKHYSDFDG